MKKKSNGKTYSSRDKHNTVLNKVFDVLFLFKFINNQLTI